jgi:hypothetical protein
MLDALRSADAVLLSDALREQAVAAGAAQVAIDAATTIVEVVA